MVQEPFGTQDPLWGGQSRDQNYIYNNTKALYAFFTLILSGVYGGIFQRAAQHVVLSLPRGQ